MNKFLQQFFKFLLLLMLSGLQSFAGIESYENFLTGAIHKDDSLRVKDEKFRNPAFNWSDIYNSTVKNTISLRILEDQPIDQDFSCKMTLRVSYFSSPDQAVASIINLVELNVNYSKLKGASYKATDSYFFNNGYEVKIDVVDISSPEFGENLPPLLQLSSHITIDRKYRFEPSLPLIVNGNISQVSSGSGGYALRGFTPGNTSNDGHYLELSWSAQFPGAEEYDVEWTVVDDLSEYASLIQQMLSHTTGVDPSPIFKNNATRITSTEEFYRISLIYNSDYILTRIRPVAYTLDGLRDEGEWNYTLGDVNNDYAVWSLSPHESDLNWQYGASYAEEGKKKEVVSYFDGTLRNRQTVTLSNNTEDVGTDENVAVVQENIYDEFGRPIANILPAPAENIAIGPEYLHFFKSFNQNTNTEPYSFKDITAGCEVSPNPLGTSMGASRYYSPSNPFIGERQNKFVPDAEGYPISITQYTADNTGRIKLQGGVGAAFQPNGTGDSHTTKYYYGKPEQWELDGLFGSDAGYAEHYLKNMVMDPNRQISVSYLNASGKTIATALSGPIPDNVDEIQSSGITNSSKKIILKPEQFKFDNSTLKLKASTTYLATIPDTAVVLNYDIEKLAYYHLDKNGFNPCSNCHYELKISMQDDCNRPIPVSPSTLNVEIGSKIQNPTDLNRHLDSITVEFNHIGEYYISFELAMNRNVIENFTDSLIVQGLRAGAIDDEFHYVLARLRKIDFTSCLNDCTNALELLGTETSFKAMINNKLMDLGISSVLGRTEFNDWIDGEYAILYAHCLNLHNNCPLKAEAPCDVYRTAMLKDISPGGQYALYTIVDEENKAIDIPANILYNNWRINSTGGVFPEKETDDPLYIETQFLRDNGEMTSPYDADFDFDDLVRYWQPDWAENFLSYHPEYCRLAYCISKSDVFEWDKQVQNQVNSVDDLHQVSATLAYSYTDPAWLMASDNFFNGIGASFASGMLLDLQQYSKRILGLNSYTAKNITQYIDYELYCKDPTASPTDQQAQWNNPCSTTCRVPDQELQRYKDIYFSLKEKYEDKYYEEAWKPLCTGLCPVGEGFGVGANSSAGFTIENSDVVLTGCEGKVIKITKTGIYNSSMYVDIHVPAEYREQVKRSVNISGSVFVCVPQDLPFESISVSPSCEYMKFFASGTWYYSSEADYFTEGDTWTFNATDGTYSGNSSGTWSLDPSNCEMTMNSNKYIVESISNNHIVLVAKGVHSNTKIYFIRNIPTSNVSPRRRVIQAEYMFEEIITGTGASGTIKNFVVDRYPNDYTEYSIFPILQNGNVPPAALQSSNGYSDETYNSPNIFRVVTKDQIYDFTNVVVRSYDRTYDYYNFSYSSSVFHPVANARYNTVGTNKYTTFFIKPNYPVELRKLDGEQQYSIDVDFRHISTGNYGGYSEWLNAVDPTETLMVPQGDPNNSILNWEHIWYGDANDPGIWYKIALKSDASYYSPIDMTTPVTNPCDAYKYKLSRFLKSQQTGSDQSADDLQSLNQTQLNDQIESACDSRIESWLQKLGPGLFGNPDSADISDELAERLFYLCMAGGDVEHPMGASTLPPGTTSEYYGDTSFGQILKSLNGGVYSKAFNPWVLDDVYPYSPLPQFTDKKIIKTTPEICAKLSNLKTESLLAGVSFHQFLADKFGRGMNITPEELTALENACSSCNNLLNQPISLPVFLDPDASNKGCITGAEYLTARNNLLNAELAGTLSPADGLLYEDVLATYMNHTFGFSMPYAEYAAFESIAINNGTATLCNLPAFRDIFLDPYACFKESMTDAVQQGQMDFAEAIKTEKELFRKGYIATCSAAKTWVEMKTQQRIFHYTLYYYDQAGNLVRTVPPEGVRFLNDGQRVAVEASRKNNATACNYTGPESNSTIATGRNTLQQVLSGGEGAIELWVYNADATGGQTLIKVNEYCLLNFCLTAGKISVELYKLNPASAPAIDIVSSSHYSANISRQALWNHIVLQSSNFSQQEGLQLWFNGTGPLILSNQPAICSWQIAGNPPTYSEDISHLKHLRTYAHELDPIEIENNASQTCFMPLNNDYLAWNRFNVPAPGSTTTTGPGTTVEASNKAVYPEHTLVTSYAYNSNNQIIKQQTPDAGTSLFWYDEMGRLLASRNAVQSGKISYTKYEPALGRILETGEMNYTQSLPGDGGFVTGTDLTNLKAAINGTSGKKQLTQTIYDDAPTNSPGTPENLRKRVAASIYKETPGSTAINATYYSYDIAGNVKTLWQKIDGLGTKKLEYEYDLVSGKVNFVAYQHGAPDQFYYQYEYDAENRLTKSWSAVQAGNKTAYGFGSQLTAADNRKLDASYSYYLHGPLARMELGRETEKVQGIDYAYTLQGWLKGVNSTNLSPELDMGQDGLSGNSHAPVARDAYSYTLHYYGVTDYKPIKTFYNATRPFFGGYTAGKFKPLYNGNIAMMNVNIPKVGPSLQYAYSYDQLNRITQSYAYDGLNTGNNTWTPNLLQDFKEEFSYDANGNILTLKRNGNNTFAGMPMYMDNLKYSYYYIKPDGTKGTYKPAEDARPTDALAFTDQLSGVSDNQDNTGNYPNDIDHQTPTNYVYDAIGNLTKDRKEGLTKIDWSVYGKIRSIDKDLDGDNLADKTITYAYDAGGNRVSKSYDGKTTYYVRDAQGNPLALYEKEGSTTTWKEQELYGSSRLGMWKPDVNLATENGSGVWDIVGKKNYELTNHLGNVLAVISEKRIAVSGGGYEAEVLSANDYYAFGSPMPGRSYSISNSNYRYGFNGKENDNEVKGEGNQQDYGMRIYDPRLGRFLSVDPITRKYPELTPYQFASNSPMAGVDLDGLEFYFAADGKFVGRGNDPTNFDIRIADKISNQGSNKIITWSKNLSDVKFNENNVKLLVGIMHYAASGLGFDKSQLYNNDFSVVDIVNSASNNWPETKGLYNFSGKPPGIESVMQTNKDVKAISAVLTNGKVPNLLNNFADFKSILFHETRHLVHSRDDFGHLETYYDQIKDKSWKNTSKEHRENTIKNIKGLISGIRSLETGSNRNEYEPALKAWESTFRDFFGKDYDKKN